MKKKVNENAQKKVKMRVVAGKRKGKGKGRGDTVPHMLTFYSFMPN